MKNTYFPPQLLQASFNCPHCHAYSAMTWNELSIPGFLQVPQQAPGIKPIKTYISDLKVAICQACDEYSIWQYQIVTDDYDEDGGAIQEYDGKMIFPSIITAPEAHVDLPEQCLSVYEEARQISHISPKATAAMLRLCIDLLLTHIGMDQYRIDGKIKNLVESGIPSQVQQALDIVRVIGNEAVHPGSINFDDDPKLVNNLFSLINIIVEDQISKPLHIQKLYDNLPAADLEKIRKRDSGTVKP